jgi:hypothetical protein
LLTLACGSQNTIEVTVEPGGNADQPSEPSDDYTYILSNFWEGSGQVIPGTSYEGQESYFYNKGLYGEDEFNCELFWDTHGIPTSIGDCPDCDFAFEITATPQQGEHVMDDGTCEEYFADPKQYHYAFTKEYEGHGPSLMYYSYDYFQWFAWFRDGDLIYDTLQIVSFDEDSGEFYYQGGFLNYYYYF